MPFISCWNKVPCTIEGKDGKQEPSTRQCGVMVACNMRMESPAADVHIWRGSCMACGATYTATLHLDSPTLAPELPKPTEPSRCLSISPSSKRCGLPLGHPGSHSTGSPGTRGETWA